MWGQPSMPDARPSDLRLPEPLCEHICSSRRLDILRPSLQHEQLLCVATVGLRNALCPVELAEARHQVLQGLLDAGAPKPAAFGLAWAHDEELYSWGVVEVFANPLKVWPRDALAEHEAGNGKVWVVRHAERGGRKAPSVHPETQCVGIGEDVAHDPCNTIPQSPSSLSEPRQPADAVRATRLHHPLMDLDAQNLCSTRAKPRQEQHATICCTDVQEAPLSVAHFFGTHLQNPPCASDLHGPVHAHAVPAIGLQRNSHAVLLHCSMESRRGHAQDTLRSRYGIDLGCRGTCQRHLPTGVHAGGVQAGENTSRC